MFQIVNHHNHHFDGRGPVWFFRGLCVGSSEGTPGAPPEITATGYGLQKKTQDKDVLVERLALLLCIASLFVSPQELNRIDPWSLVATSNPSLKQNRTSTLMIPISLFVCETPVYI